MTAVTLLKSRFGAGQTASTVSERGGKNIWYVGGLLVASSVAAAVLQRTNFGSNGEMLLVTATLVTATLVMAVACLHGMVGRLCGDPRALWIGLSLLVSSASAVLTGSAFQRATAPADLHSLVISRYVCAITAIVLFVIAALWRPDSQVPPTKGRVRPMFILKLVGGAAFVAALVVSALSAHVVLALGWSVGAIVHLVVSRGESSRLLSWSVLAAGGFSIAQLVEAAGGASARHMAMAFTSIAVLPALFGLSGELRRLRAHDQQQAMDAYAEAAVAEHRAEMLVRGQAEFSHDAHTALIGIEAAAVALSQHRQVLSAEELATLSSALVNEVHRLQKMIDAPVTESLVEFDVRDALLANSACVGSAGLDVACFVPAGMQARGVPEFFTRVATELFANARRHAPGSPVFVEAYRELGEIVVTVSDFGPGINPDLGDSIFDNGVYDTANGGSGLGLHTAQRLMADQGGSLHLRSSDTKGTCFVLRLLAATEPSSRKPPGITDDQFTGDRRIP